MLGTREWQVSGTRGDEKGQAEDAAMANRGNEQHRCQSYDWKQEKSLKYRCAWVTVPWSLGMLSLARKQGNHFSLVSTGAGGWTHYFDTQMYHVTQESKPNHRYSGCRSLTPREMATRRAICWQRQTGYCVNGKPAKEVQRNSELASK